MTNQLDPRHDGDAKAFGLDPGLIDAVLEGGPLTFPTHLRTHRVSATERKVKIEHYGGYEHFERGPDTEHAPTPDAPVVFRWTARTRVAE